MYFKFRGIQLAYQYQVLPTPKFVTTHSATMYNITGPTLHYQLTIVIATHRSVIMYFMTIHLLLPSCFVGQFWESTPSKTQQRCAHTQTIFAWLSSFDRYVECTVYTWTRSQSSFFRLGKSAQAHSELKPSTETYAHVYKEKKNAPCTTRIRNKILRFA